MGVEIIVNKKLKFFIKNRSKCSFIFLDCMLHTSKITHVHSVVVNSMLLNTREKTYKCVTKSISSCKKPHPLTKKKSM